MTLVMDRDLRCLVNKLSREESLIYIQFLKSVVIQKMRDIREINSVICLLKGKFTIIETEIDNVKVEQDASIRPM